MKVARGHLRFRPGTIDHLIFRDVFDKNEYRAMRTDFEGRTVIDVGAHVGGFCHLASHLGAQQVEAYEVHPDTFALLTDNCRELPVRCYQEAAFALGTERVRIDPTARIDCLSGIDLTVNTGSFSVWNRGDHEVRAVDLATMVARAGGEHLVCKLDCEGAEYPLLYGADEDALVAIDFLLGECHDLPERATARASHGQLQSHLEAHGFRVEMEQTHKRWRRFWARRRR